MADVGDIKRWWLFGVVVDTPQEGTEQHKKLEELKSIIDRGKLGHR